MYVNLRTFSHYSRFESTIFIKDLIKKSIELNLPAVALCDRMNIFGSVEFFTEAKKIKPVLGCLVDTYDFGFIPMFIQNQQGFEYLSYILSMAAIRNGKVTTAELEQNKGIIALSGGLDGIFYQNPSLKKLEELNKIFAHRFYVEIQNESGKNWLLKSAYDLNIPIVCTKPVYFLEEQDAESYLILNLIKNKKIYSSDLPLCDNWLKTNHELQIQEGIENSFKIMQRCSFFLQSHKPIFPKFCSTKEEEIELLKKTSYEKLQEKLSHKPNFHDYKKQMDFELEVIITKGFAGYFLITQDFVNYAKQNNIEVGPGRGSGTGSLVAFCLGITNVDPLEFKLIFERFLNPERNALPDFDIDYDPERREEVIDYLKKKYGNLNVSHIITFGKLQARGAIRDVARALGFSFSKSDEICKLIPEDQVNPISLKEALEIVPQLKKLTTNIEYKKLLEISLKLEGVCRNLSKHAAGIVLADNVLYKYCPITRVENGDMVTQLNLKNLEYLGLIKFDFLGLRTLSINSLAIEYIKKNKNIEIKHIPLNDEKTFKLIQDVRLFGIFQLENPALKDIIRQMKPNHIEDIIALISLWRPGPVKNIPLYVKRKNNLEPTVYAHPLLENILKNTYGIMVYQEQVMEIARVCANYSLSEADNLRRAMGKKQHEEMENQRSRFLAGCLENNIDESISTFLFNQMTEFSGYGFNKGHAAPYGIISYTSAYIKANYPEEFFAAFLSLETDPESIINSIYELRNLFIKILPPCVRHSEYNVSIVSGEKNTLRLPIRFIKNVGKKLTENIERYKYESIFDFFNKNQEFLNVRTFKHLIFSGALDSFNYTRKTLFNNTQSIMMNEFIENNEQEWGVLEKAEKEYEALNFLIDNPLKELRDILKHLHLSTCKDLQKQKMVMAQIVKITRKRKGSNNYAVLQISDETDLISVTGFNKTLECSFKVGQTMIFSLYQDRVLKIISLEDFFQENRTLELFIQSEEELIHVINIINKQEKGNLNLKIYFINYEHKTEQLVRDSLELRIQIKNYYL